MGGFFCLNLGFPKNLMLKNLLPLHLLNPRLANLQKLLPKRKTPNKLIETSNKLIKGSRPKN